MAFVFSSSDSIICIRARSVYKFIITIIWMIGHVETDKLLQTSTHTHTQQNTYILSYMKSMQVCKFLSLFSTQWNIYIDLIYFIIMLVIGGTFTESESNMIKWYSNIILFHRWKVSSNIIHYFYTLIFYMGQLR